MHAIQQLSHATPDSIRAELLGAVTYLLKRVRRRMEVLDEMQQVRDLLDALPLDTDLYGSAVNRLGNAHRYLLSQEHGAASYELKLLAGGLRSQQQPAAARRKRPVFHIS